MDFNPNEAEAPPSDNLYVADLPADTTEDSLRSMFGPDVVQCRVLPSKTPGQGSCVALVRFSSVKQAAVVRETLNGAIPPGQQRAVTIRFCGKPGGAASSYTKGPIGAPSSSARQSPYGGERGGKGASGGQQQSRETPQPNDNLYITGLPPGIDNASLKGLFGQYGTVVQSKVLPVLTEGQCPHALVRFSTVEEAANVKKSLTGYALEGVNEPLNVEFAIQKQKPSAAEAWNAIKSADSSVSKGGGKGGNDGGWDGGKGGSDGSWEGGKGGCWVAKGCEDGGKGCWGGKGFDDGSKGGWCAKGMEDGKGCWGGKGWDDGGKGGWVKGGDWDWGSGKGKGGKGGMCGPSWGNMDTILQGFVEAKCLPGNELGNEDNCLFISGLPKDCDDIHLYRLLAPFGAITPTGVKAMKHPDGACKGFGFVNFVEHASLQAASMMLDGTQLPDGSCLSAGPKKAKKGSSGGKGNSGGDMNGSALS